jgi:hypothetical protein
VRVLEDLEVNLRGTKITELPPYLRSCIGVASLAL